MDRNTRTLLLAQAKEFQAQLVQAQRHTRHLAKALVCVLARGGGSITITDTELEGSTKFALQQKTGQALLCAACWRPPKDADGSPNHAPECEGTEEDIRPVILLTLTIIEAPVVPPSGLVGINGETIN